MSRSTLLEPGDSAEHDKPQRRLESLDDITREIADRRLEQRFRNEVPPEKWGQLVEKPSLIEDQASFNHSATEAGFKDTEGLLGYATRPEDPAHVLKTDLPERITTLEHENLHRLTAPELLREAGDDPELRRVYEGVTEYLAQQASEGLHEFEAGRVYPEEVEDARHLAAEVGDDTLRNWYFQHRGDQEIREALQRLGVGDRLIR
jgi:hypothetical protein